MKKGNWKKIMSILAATIGTTFVITSLVAKKEIGKSQYKDESNQMNPLEGKKVVFIENADWHFICVIFHAHNFYLQYAC